jgi:hypothetical protein
MKMIVDAYNSHLHLAGILLHPVRRLVGAVIQELF